MASEFDMTATVCIEAPADEVWRCLARIEDIPLWSRAIISASTVPGHERGVGAERACKVVGGIDLTERWLAWDEGVSFTYEGTGLPGVRVARNTWTVEPLGAQSILRSEAHVEFKRGPLGPLLKQLAKRQSARMGRQSLGAFKYLVETGEPPSDLSVRLPVPATC
ncbi:MAG: SRPBCC family protein [Actinobacteria bacterium]|nr:SRPBCC family protein [Actinomycetota bacterium]